MPPKKWTCKDRHTYILYMEDKTKGKHFQPVSGSISKQHSLAHGNESETETHSLLAPMLWFNKKDPKLEHVSCWICFVQVHAKRGKLTTYRPAGCEIMQKTVQFPVSEKDVFWTSLCSFSILPSVANCMAITKKTKSVEWHLDSCLQTKLYLQPVRAHVSRHRKEQNSDQVRLSQCERAYMHWDWNLQPAAQQVERLKKTNT